MATTTNVAMIPSEMTGSRRPRARASTGAPISGTATTLICFSGGPEMAPRPPALGRAAAEPWRASGLVYDVSSCVPDARVDHRVEAVHAQVDEGHDGRGGQHDGLDDREVAGGDAVVGQATQTRPCEHGLHHDGRGHQDGEVDAGEGHHRDERILERMD